MAVNIQLEWTPNPSTLKYVTDRVLMPRGAVITPVYQHRVAHEGPTAATVFASRSDGARSHRENRVDLEEIPIADCVHPA